MKIQLIADGSTNWQRTIKRWGVSFLIGDDVLFDTFGDRNVFIQNIKDQKIDLSLIRHIVISHDHWDHIDGLWDVIEKYRNIKVYVVPHFQEQIKDAIRKYGVDLVETLEPVMIREGVFTTGELSGTSTLGIVYEQSLVIQEGTRLHIVTGCAHPQLLHILHGVKKNFHGQIESLIGGFHLKNLDYDQIQDIVAKVCELGVKIVVPLHCTGDLATKELKRVFKENCIKMVEGDVMEI